MDRYHFNLKDGVFAADPVGQELPSVDAARNAAANVLAESLKGNPALLFETGHLSVIVTDDAGLTLFSVDVVATDAPAPASPRRRGR